MKVKFIVNPKAGRGKGKRAWAVVRGMLEREGYPYDDFVTSRPGQTQEAAHQAAREGYDIVVALGGDGTVHEVANGIMGTGAALGVISAGTGGDYVRSLPLPRDPEEAGKVIFHGQKTYVDIGRVNDRYFIGVTGMGFDAEVCRLVNEDLSWLQGKTAYVAGVLVTMASYRPQRVEITLDDVTFQEEVMVVAVANARYFGGGMLLAPEADLKDGLLDLCLVRSMPKWELLRVFPQIFSGKHTTHRAFCTLRGRRIRVVGDSSCSIQAEGEIIGTLPLEAEVLPKALPVMVEA